MRESPIIGIEEYGTLAAAMRYQKINEFLDKARDAVAAALEAGMTPNYLFVGGEYAWLPGEVYGLKIWATKLPEPHKIIAVAVPDVASGGP